VPALDPRRFATALVAVVVATTLAVPGAAASARGAVPADDELDELVERRVELLFARGLMELHDAATRDALAALAPRIVEAERISALRQEELARAILEAQRTAAAEAATRAELAELEQQMRDMAVAAYVRPPQSDELTTFLDAASPAHAERMSAYLDAKASHDADIAERLRRTRIRLERQVAAARAAERRADEREEEAAAALADLQAARAEQELLLVDIGQRRATAELESYAVALEIDEARRRLAAEARRSRDGGRGVPLENVDGIWVHEDLAGALAALLEDAAEDGIHLSGGGYRDNAAQIALRRANCGEDDFAVWEMSPSQCSPPTARPGTSMHELGLAVDFTVDGRIISTRSSPGFRWLAEHAAGYGLYNLPSEPWHWSVSGG
jgi:hypothetical protein